MKRYVMFGLGLLFPLLPVMALVQESKPEAIFPAAALADFAETLRSHKFDQHVYEFFVGTNVIGGNPKYQVTVITPIFAWYQVENRRIQAAKEEQKQNRKAGLPSDPTQLQWNWSSYEGKFPAVVRIAAFPQMAETTGSRFVRGVNPFRKPDIKFKVSFHEMTLLCDGKEVTPIERKKSPVEIPEEYAAGEGFLAFQGNYTYSVETFGPNSCKQLELRICSEDDPSKPDLKTIPAKTVERVWADFGGYRKAGKSQ